MTFYILTEWPKNKGILNNWTHWNGTGGLSEKGYSSYQTWKRENEGKYTKEYICTDKEKFLKKAHSVGLKYL